MCIEGSVLKVLDSKRLIADVGREAGVEPSMEFIVYESIELGQPYGSWEVEKSTLSPSDIREKMTIMETISEKVEIDFSTLSNFPVSPTERNIQEEMKVEDEIPDDFKIVREGDLVKQVKDEEETNQED